MTPGQFDIDTAKEMVGDAHCRVIEADARKAAEDDRNDPSDGVMREYGSTYYCSVMREMERRVWIFAHQKRLDRLARMKEQNG